MASHWADATQPWCDTYYRWATHPPSQCLALAMQSGYTPSFFSSWAEEDEGSWAYRDLGSTLLTLGPAHGKHGTKPPLHRKGNGCVDIYGTPAFLVMLHIHPGWDPDYCGCTPVCHHCCSSLNQMTPSCASQITNIIYSKTDLATDLVSQEV